MNNEDFKGHMIDAVARLETGQANISSWLGKVDDKVSGLSAEVPVIAQRVVTAETAVAEVKRDVKRRAGRWGALTGTPGGFFAGLLVAGLEWLRMKMTGE